MKVRLQAAVLTLLVGVFVAAVAQNGGAPQQAPTSNEGGGDSNPIKIVFLQIRSEYANLNGNNWAEALIIRSDKAVLKKNRFGGKVGVLTRYDIPIVTVKLGPSTHAGLGDIYLQFLHLPFLHPRFAFAFGSGLSLPTATSKTLGTGKWMIGPVVAPLFFFNRGNFGFVKFQDFVSFAGPSSRSALHYLLITPLIRWRLPHQSWVLVTAESRTGFRNSNHTWFKGGVQLGHVFSNKLAAWIEPDILWGGTRPGSFNLKFSFVRSR